MSDFESNDKVNLRKDFEEQYAQLQQEQEKKEKRKTIILLILFMLTLLVSTFGATYSYLTIKNSQNVTPVLPKSYIILKDGRSIHVQDQKDVIKKDKFQNIIIPDGGATIKSTNGETTILPKGSIVTCDGIILIPVREGNEVRVKEDGNYLIPNGGATKIDINGNKEVLKAGLHVGNCSVLPPDSSNSTESSIIDSSSSTENSSTTPIDSSSSSQTSSTKPEESSTTPIDPTPEDPDPQTITIIYTDTSSYKAESVLPGWTSEAAKTFTVRCEGAATGYYKVEWKNVINTFNHPEDLVYTVKINGITQFEDREVPKNDSVFLSNMSIVPGGVQNYEIFFKYINRSGDQSIDQDKTFSGVINVSVD